CVGPGLADLPVKAYIDKETGKVVAFAADDDNIPEWATHKIGSSAPIRGFVIVVNSDNLFELDRVMGNSIYFRRVEAICELWRFRNGPQCIQPAWIYLGIPDRWDVDAGYKWQPLKILNKHFFCERSHYYHSRSSPLVQAA